MAGAQTYNGSFLKDGMFFHQYCFICYFWKRCLFRFQAHSSGTRELIKKALSEDLELCPASELLSGSSSGSSLTSVLWTVGQTPRTGARRRGFEDWLCLELWDLGQVAQEQNQKKKKKKNKPTKVPSKFTYFIGLLKITKNLCESICINLKHSAIVRIL